MDDRQQNDPQGSLKVLKLASPQSYARLGYLLILLAFGGLGTWAALARIDSATVASGVVALENDRQVVQHLEGGIVQAIHVREADRVDQGDILITLEDVEARANVERLADRVDEALTVEARLLAELDLATEVRMTEDLPSRNAAKHEKLMRSQNRILADRIAIFESQADILRSRIDQLEEQARGLQQQRVATEQRLVIRAGLLERLTRGEEQGLVEGNLLAERQDSLIQLEASLGEVISQAAQMRAGRDEARFNLIKLRQEFIERANLELEKTRGELGELREQLRVARDILKRTEIRAPKGGIVQNVRVTTLGSVVRPGEILLEVVPQDDDLIVSARISPVDVDSVSAGQETMVRFSTIKSTLTPIILGRLESVSNDVIAPQSAQEEPFYLGRIRIPDENMPEEVKQKIVPGMPTEVVIVNGERSVLSYVVSPLLDAIATSMKEQ